MPEEDATVVDRPVFMIGTGRSGTTLAFSLVARHDSLAWYSNYDARFGGAVPSRWVRRAIGVPPVSKGNWRSRRRWAVQPQEFYKPLDEAFPGFSQPFRNLEASDATPWAARRLQNLLAEKAAADRKARVLLKWTGWSRAGFMDAIFPDCLFVHVHRNGCAVANSLMQRDFWRGWRGPSQWRWGPLPPEMEETWLRHDRSFVVLAGLQWKLLFREITASLDRLPPGRVLQLSYEALCADPVGEVGRIHRFASLPDDPHVAERVRATKIRAENVERWRTDLSRDQVAVLEEVLAEDLAIQREMAAQRR